MQSGSDEILKRMNRKYDSKHYMKIIKSCKKAMPNIAISTDIIVGFPGETEEDFKKTLEIVNEALSELARNLSPSAIVATTV